MEFVDRPFPKTLDTFIVGVVREVYESFFLYSLSVFCRMAFLGKTEDD